MSEKRTPETEAETEAENEASSSLVGLHVIFVFGASAFPHCNSNHHSAPMVLDYYILFL